MKKILLMFFLMSMFLVGNSIPKWYLNNGTQEYNTAYYFVGLGEGESYDEASKSAQMDIASQIKTKIDSSLESKTTQVTGNENSYNKNVQLNIKSSSNEILTGVEFVKKEKSENSFYVLAVLEKSKYLLGIETELNKMKDEIEEIDNLKNNPLILLKEYVKAGEKMEKFYQKKILHDAISNKEYMISPTFRNIDFNTKIKNTISNIYLEVVSGENQTGKEGETLKNPVVFEAKYKEEVIPKFPIMVKEGNGKILGKFATDENGQIEVYATVFTDESKKGRIIAGVDLLKMPSEIRDDFKNVKVYANYSREKENKISFSINIIDEKNKKIKEINRKVTRLVTKGGNVISEKSNLNLDGKIIINEIKEVESFGGMMYIANISLDLNVIDNRNDLILSSMNSKGKGMGRNESQAIMSAYKKIKISQKSFSMMIAEAKDKLK